MMDSLNFAMWAGFVFAFYIFVPLFLDRMSRRFFTDRLIQASRRRVPNLSRLRLWLLYAFNTLLIAAFTYTALYFYERGQGSLYPMQVQSAYDLILIVLQAFLILIIFDANFYGMHRLFHSHKKLFRWLHADHHEVRFPNVWHVHYQNPLDYLLTTVSPMLWVIFLPIPLSLQSYLAAIVIASFVNIAGHCGYEITGTSLALGTFNGWASFVDPRRVWVARLFNNVLHHDLHHQKVATNYSLYFTWWDRLFKTYDAGTDQVDKFSAWHAKKKDL